MNNKRELVTLYKDIVLVTRERIFCTTLFTNNNIKVGIQKSYPSGASTEFLKLHGIF